MSPQYILLVLFCLLSPIIVNSQADSSSNDKPREIREFLDLQIHPTMHVPYSFFGKGLEYFNEENPPKLKYKHQLKNANYANYLRKNKGARIIVNGSLTNEDIKSKVKARRMILEQIKYVNDFAEQDSNFVVARSPQEVRDWVWNTDKTIILHSLEGARQLVNSQEDAEFWYNQGVAFITLVHLVDNKLGGAAIKPGLVPSLLNFKGKFKNKKKRGLKEKGKKAIRWLANAGVMIDLTHMSQQTRTDALKFMESEGIPPLSSHDLFKPIQNHPRGIPEEEVLKFYELGGYVSLPISAESLKPKNPRKDYKVQMDSLEKAGCYCEGSIHDYKFTYEAVKAYIEENVHKFYPDSTSFEELTEEEKVRFAIGCQSDFNGWLNHHRPVYGKKGCYKLEEGKEYDRIETEGMPHPGFLADHWEWLLKNGVDITPVQRSSERFLQLWQEFLDKRGQFSEKED